MHPSLTLPLLAQGRWHRRADRLGGLVLALAANPMLWLALTVWMRHDAGWVLLALLVLAVPMGWWMNRTPQRWRRVSAWMPLSLILSVAAVLFAMAFLIIGNYVCLFWIPKLIG